MNVKEKDLFGKFKKFLVDDVWTMEKNATPSSLRPFIAPIRVIHMIVHDFMAKKTLSMASSPPYTSSLS